MASVEVTRLPLVNVVEPVVPDWLAVHVLVAWSAVKPPEPPVPTAWIWVELVTVPPLGVPWVLIAIGPEVNIVAGPNAADPDAALAVTGVAEPAAGSDTVGVGPTEDGLPPNRLRLA